ncbi:hypothetical protein H1C71_035617 [Ictidomys tridecemlineatus]|nr:hypothetical protein H1C71_035617 [Ictidomys tridecemlineatus]
MSSAPAICWYWGFRPVNQSGPVVFQDGRWQPGNATGSPMSPTQLGSGGKILALEPNITVLARTSAVYSFFSPKQLQKRLASCVGETHTNTHHGCQHPDPCYSHQLPSPPRLRQRGLF